MADGRLDVTIPTFIERTDQRLGAVRLAVAGVYPVRVSLRAYETSATLGQSGSITVTTNGLTAGVKYLGSVAYGGATGMPNPTIVRVDP